MDEIYLSTFQLFNYKSFLDSGMLEFTPGINIIVGQNNSGKTALLEALTLNFDNVPHLSIITLPTPSSPVKGKSQVQFSLTFKKDEIRSIIDFIQDQPKGHYVGIRRPDDLNLNVETLVAQFQKWLDTSGSGKLLLSFSSPDDINEENVQIIDLNFHFYWVQDEGEGHNYVFFLLNRGMNERFELQGHGGHMGPKGQSIPLLLLKQFRSCIYRFYAERLNLGTCSFGYTKELKQNASNLAEVLNALQGVNPARFERFNKLVSVIFPQIKRIAIHPRHNSLEIMVWTVETETEREDLSFPLSSCGTGIGQVLAILYVVLTSQEARTIIIDEPQSFLHPGAAKKLVEILKEFPQHQYFIATHSPMIIAAANPSTIVKLRYEDGETKASVMNSEDVKEQRSLLAELGVSLSDVFGADNILWVEGPTEERCFPLILEKVAKKPLRGTQILAIKNTGDLEGKRAHVIFDIYDKLSGGKSLFPPAIGFVLDSEGRSEREVEDLKRRTHNPVEFLPRRMYENYLLHPEAIAIVINKEDESREEPITSTEVQEWLDKTKQEGHYLPKGVQKEGLSDSEWLCKVDGANLLKSLFTEFSEARVEFSKTKHSFELTEWLVEKEPDRLSELADFLQNVLDRGEEKLRGCL
ncbi:MAG TPA: AAA family ATPase [Leptolyngbyaceae cyanobacterium]